MHCSYWISSDLITTWLFTLQRLTTHPAINARIDPVSDDTQSSQKNMAGIWKVLFWIFSGGRGPSRLPSTIFDQPAREHTILQLHVQIKFLDLSIELLHNIFSYLPLSSQVCLALSSKGLYALFNSVLGASELRFPAMPRNGKSYAMSEECYLRTTLLTQLEDSLWAFCVGCQKLHPRQEFPELLLRSKRSCTNFAGIVDLCPCIALTLRDRTRIVEYLRSGGTVESKRILNTIRNGSLVLNEDRNGLHLLHTCHAYQNIQAEIKLSATKDKQLISRDRYQTLPTAVDTDMDSVPVCCDKDLSSCFSKPISNCSSCHARTIALTSINANVRVAQVTRYLGRGKCVTNYESIDPEEKWVEFLEELSGTWASDDPWSAQCRPLHYYYPPAWLPWTQMAFTCLWSWWLNAADCFRWAFWRSSLFSSPLDQ